MYRYNRFSAYGQSKLANVLHTNELARRLKVRDSFKAVDYMSLCHYSFRNDITLLSALFPYAKNTLAV